MGRKGYSALWPKGKGVPYQYGQRQGMQKFMQNTLDGGLKNVVISN